MSTFVCRSNNNAKVPSICPSTWREVNGLVLFLMLPSCFTSSLPLSVSLLQSLWLFSYRGLNEWKEKSTETRLVSSCSAHSMWPRFKSSLSALRAQIGHCYWHLRSFSRYSSLSPSTLRDPLSLYCGSLLVFIFTHSVCLIKFSFSASVLSLLFSWASAEMMLAERMSGDCMGEVEAVRLSMNTRCNNGWWKLFC